MNKLPQMLIHTLHLGYRREYSTFTGTILISGKTIKITKTKSHGEIISIFPMRYSIYTYEIHKLLKNFI